MAVDLAGVPVRVRSQLARLRPEHKDALRAVWRRARPGGRGPDRVEAAVGSWFAAHSDVVHGRVLEVGVAGLAEGAAATEVEVLDPWGCRRARYVGAVGEVVPVDRFDVVLAPLRLDDPVTAADPGAAIAVLVGALRAGGVLLATVVGADEVAGAELGESADRAGADEVRIAPLADEAGSLGATLVARRASS